jgi:mono/diheme cytochrome c family protein
MSDRELSDVVAYIRSRPPMFGEVPAIKLGPLGKVLVATGNLVLAADRILSHDTPHVVYPPATAVTVEFGRHLAGVCTGCHGEDLAGGPIAGGDPSWPPARNLTPHAEALGAWSYEDFDAALTQGVRPDGSALLEPMTLMTPYARNMEEVERRALWEYLRTVAPIARR